MSSRLTMLAARREELVAQSRAHRAEIRQHGERIHGQIAWADKLMRAGQALKRSGPVVAGAFALFLMVGPKRIVNAILTGMRYAPIVMNAYRFARRGVGIAQDEPRS